MNVFYIIIYIKILYKYRCKFIGIFKEYLLSIFMYFIFITNYIFNYIYDC